MESGTPTFLFTDLEASTRRWEAHPEAMSGALARHDALLRGAVAGHGGTVFKHTGDGFCAVFPDARAALAAAVAGQQAMAAEEWGEVGPLRVRMALHSGTAEHRDGDWFGPALNRTARLLATAHGAQVVVSLATAELSRDVLPPKVELVDLGEHRLADLSRTERVFQLSHPDLEAEFPPLRSLTGGARTALPRHRTLRAAIDWSWDMLGPGERAVLRRLAVCAGTFNLEAAEAVADDDDEVAAADVLDLISDLVDKSLVAVEAGPGEARYRLSETVRHYAADRLAEAGEAVATRHRHRDFFVGVGRRESTPYNRSASWFGRLAADRDNFRAALEWCFASGATLSALRLAGALGELWIGEGRFDEASAWLERALAEASDAPVRTRGRVLCELAYVRQERGELAAARAVLEEASALFDAVSDREGRLRVLMMESLVVLQQGDVETAERLSHEGISLAESLGTPAGTAWCRFGLGWVFLARGDREAAVAHFEAALAFFREAGSWDLTPASLAALAPLVAAGGDIARANALIDEALTMARSLGRIHLVMALTRAAEVGVVVGDWRRAAEALSESLGLLSDIGGRSWVADSLELAALVAVDRGRPGPAARLLGAADRIRAAIGESGRVRLVRTEIDRARHQAAQALGSDAFAGETGRGEAMSPEAALAYALDQLSTPA